MRSLCCLRLYIRVLFNGAGSRIGASTTSSGNAGLTGWGWTSSQQGRGSQKLQTSVSDSPIAMESGPAMEATTPAKSGSVPAVKSKASGVTVADKCIEIFTDMKVRKTCTEEERKKRIKAVIFCLSPDKKMIIPEQGKVILVGDIGTTICDAYKHFVEMLPPNDCRYAIFDCSFETKESKKEELVFVFWAPDDSSMKSKMIYASSKDGLKKKLCGVKHEMQANCLSEIKDRSCLADKLGSNVISLEGVRL